MRTLCLTWLLLAMGATGLWAQAVANFGTSGNGPHCPAYTVLFTDSSYSAAGPITSHFWNFGDGSNSTQTSPVHVYMVPGTFTASLIVEDAAGNRDTASTTITVSGPQVVTTSAPASCAFNGMAAVAATGGTPPYAYFWSTGYTTASITGLQAGTYYVTVTDANGCMNSGSVTVVDANPITYTVSATPTSCLTVPDGSITITASGGTPPYEYSLDGFNYQTSNTITNMNGYDYGLYIRDAGGCVHYDTLVGIGSGFNGTVGMGDPICGTGAPGTILVLMNNPTGHYKYALNNWPLQVSNELEVWSAGTHTIYVQDTQTLCITSTSFTVAPITPITGYMTGRAPTCDDGANGRLAIYASGGAAPLAYDWSSGGTGSSLNNIPAGTYTVTVTDSRGCTYIDSKTIVSYLITGVLTEDVSCNGGADGQINVDFATGGAAPYSFSVDGGNTFQPVGTPITGLTAGTYNVLVQDDNGCTFDTVANITEPAPLALRLASSQPTCGTCADGSITAQVTGGTGQYSYAWSIGANTASVSNRLPGQYSVTVADGNGCTISNTITLAAPCNMSAALAVTTPISCDGMADGVITSTVQGGTGPFTYTWLRPNTGGGPPPPPGPGDYYLDQVDSGYYAYTVTDAAGCIFNTGILVGDPDPLVVGGLVTSSTCPSTCADGEINATVIGGTPPYTYNWSGNAGGQLTAQITGLLSGPYIVTVVDANGCVDVHTFLNPGCSLIVTATGMPVSCNGGADGEVTTIAINGTRPYQYSIDGGISWQSDSTFTGLPAGFYPIQVRDVNGCTGSYTQVIGEPSPLVVSVLPTDAGCPTCNDGKIIASITGGEPGLTGYDLYWSNGATGNTFDVDSVIGLPPGNYDLTVSDANGCTATINNITVGAGCGGIAVSIGSDTTICSGGSYTITSTVTGGSAPFTYLWNNFAASPNITVSTTDQYILLVTDNNGCTASDTVEVTFGNPSFTVSNDTLICSGGTAQLTASGGVSYSWTPAASLNSPTIANPIAAPTASTIYQVTITDLSGCSATLSVPVSVDTSCVWPGDANDDGIANNNDVLAIGIGYNFTGPVRPNASLVWEAQPGAIWSSYLANGANLKHTDCNGDGVIDNNDTTAVSLNYSLTHSKTGIRGNKVTDPSIYYVFPTDSVAAGTTIDVDIYLGQDTLPVDSVYGLAFSIGYDMTLVDSATVSFSPDVSWMGTPGVDLLVFQKDRYGNSKLDMAITRIDHTNRGGFGRIGVVSLTMKDDISGKQWLSVPFAMDIVDVRMITATEAEIPVFSEEQAIVVYDPLSGIDALPAASALRVYPNPANGQLFVHLPGMDIQQLQLTNLMGQTVVEMSNLPAGPVAIDLKDVEAGAYFVQVHVNGQMMVHKVLIER